MAQQQEEGWPLGLQPLNMRAGVARNQDFLGSISFSTLITGSPSSSTASSSDFDTESTGSFFHDTSITLGSLIGVSSILELSRRSSRGRSSKAETVSLRSKKSSKSRSWFLSLCSRTDDTNTVPSLGHFLEVERRASNDDRSNQHPMFYDPSEFTESEPNHLFINGHVAPPQSSPLFGSNAGGRRNKSLGQIGVCGVPVLCSCLSGQSTN